MTAQHVDRFVKKGFQPSRDIGRFLAHAPGLEAVSQYAPGVESLILMEPLVLRPRIDEDIRKFARRFGAYSAALASRAIEGPTVDMWVYALPGIPDQSIQELEHSISYCSARVFAVGDAVQKARLLDGIRAVGAETLLVN